MPQTTEEHLELENDDDDKSDSEKNLDGEVSSFFVKFSYKVAEFLNSFQEGFQLLLA